MTTAAVPSATPNGPATYSMASLYVGDLHPDVNEAMLFEKFSSLGQVLSIRVCRDNASRLSLGYAYVNYQQPADAERALDSMNFEPLHGRPMRIMWSQRDPAGRRSGNGNIFIKNLDKLIDNKAIHDTFSLFGNILSCKVAVDEENRSKGYGFVHFETEDSALQAIDKVNGMLLGGRKVYVGKFQPRVARLKEFGEPDKSFTNVFVKNFGQELDKEKLEKMFSKFGKITSCEVMLDGENKSKGFGFVAFENPQDAEQAVNEMNDTVLDGSDLKLYAGRAQKKSERQAELKKQHSQQKSEANQETQGTNLFVKNIDTSMDDEALHKLFEPFGNILSAKVMKDEQDQSKGFGFVSFELCEDASKAVTEVNGKMVCSKPLYVAVAQRRDERRAQLASHYMQRLTSMRMQNGAGGSMYTPAQGGYFVANNMQPQRYMHVGGAPHAGNHWSNVPAPPGQFNQFIQPGVQSRRPDAGNFGSRPNAFSQGNVPGARIQPRPTQTNSFSGQPQAGFSRNEGRSAATGATPGAAPGMNRHYNNRQQNDGIAVHGQEPLSMNVLMNAAPQEQKQILGERIYTMIDQMYPGKPADAGKITGMMLEMDNAELLMMMQDQDVFRSKVNEAALVLKSAHRP